VEGFTFGDSFENLSNDDNLHKIVPVYSQGMDGIIIILSAVCVLLSPTSLGH
jgi:hypothetical protein